jgi:hypothetical protein
VKRLLILILNIGLFVNAKAQSELTLPFMTDIFQSSYINPTVLPEHSVSIGLPGMSSVYFQAITNGFVANNFMYFKDSMHVDLNKFVAELKEQNMINSNTSVDLLHIRMKIRNGFYWVGVRTNFNMSFMYPKELFAFPIEGNVSFIGKNMDFSNLKIDATLYNEYSFGMAKDYNRWTFGGRISLLQGLSNIQFDPKSFNILMDSTTYQNTGNADAQLNIAGIPRNSAGDPSFDHVQNGNYITNYLTNFKNRGYSLSAGVAYKPNDRLNFSVAFSDLGYINWKDSVTNYTLNGSSTLPLDIVSSMLNNKKISLDSIIDQFSRDTINKSYRTYLHPKYLASASYRVFRRTTIGISASGVYNKKLYPAYTFGISQGVGRFFNLLATASYNQRTIKNLGLGLLLKPGTFQFYVIVDNAYPLINPLYTTNVNVRVGLNFVFGRIKPSVGLPYR